ncbi:MAG: hypothetical protein U9Q97_04075 [Acidobacteriota bacterium]|nr:hypothetical protein [Acidobacteriota bacterium]
MNGKLAMKMKCTISMDGKRLEALLRKKITEEEFASFCKDAVLSKLWQEQIVNLDRGKK